MEQIEEYFEQFVQAFHRIPVHTTSTYLLYADAELRNTRWRWTGMPFACPYVFVRGQNRGARSEDEFYGVPWAHVEHVRAHNHGF